MSCDHDQAPMWPTYYNWPAPAPDSKGQCLSRQDRSAINRQAHQAARLHYEQERKRLRGLPYLSKSEANRLALQLSHSFYEQERRRLIDLASD